MSVTLPTPAGAPDLPDAAPDTTTPPTPGGEQQTFLRPRRAARRDWLRAGFFAMLGAGLLALLALTAWKFLEAALAVITPFAVGLVLALLLDPMARALQKHGSSRAMAAGLVFVGLLVLIGAASWLIVPALVNEASDLAQNGPKFIAGLKDTVQGFLNTHHKIGPLTLPSSFQQISDQVSARASALLQNSAGRLTGLLVGSVTLLVEMILTLIVTFFLLVDLDRLRARLFYLAPESWRPRMGQMGHDVGGVFGDYLAGLLKVCTLYGIVTIALLYALSLVHHPLARYALLVGAAAGVLYAVPYVGSTTSALVTFLVAFASATTPHHSGLGFAGAAVAATLVVNQVFDNIVTPRVVGGGVGLHPVLALFALVIGGEMFGIWGMLLSVPIAASIQVILFRLFPKLTAPTPPAFLRAQGVPPDKKESSKIMEGSDSVTADNQAREA